MRPLLTFATGCQGSLEILLFLALLVGGQAAFYVRPFFGVPASRGRTPPFLPGNEPDVRGATNFFELLSQFSSYPKLPEWFTPTPPR